MNIITKLVLTNNLLGLGLLSHLSALVITAIPIFEKMGTILYIIATCCLLFGTFLTQEQQKKDRRFYVAYVASFFPLIGPFITLRLLYTLSEKRGKESWIKSIFTLKIHLVALLVWIIVLVITTAWTLQQHDPYFNKSYNSKTN